ncbi:hypothetical protein GGR88_001775 [Sphingomonas jejuensis]|uniref:Uncharacterized protein n=1 Tax=Sphingomonas jejuensis TaxID=904715 RepID=A0ABX0XLQ6_9SPHN|nr:hypothetical protein [Sphingomonas jejuensis]NJC34301.1 hypothetical protein [Sphingomonas jejuensis]
MDPIAGLPPRLVYAAILLLDLAVIALLLTGVLWLVDRVEDRIFPGGTEWLPF